MILPMQSRTHQMWRLVFNLAKDAWMTTRCTSYSAYSASILLKSLCLMDLEDLASLNGTSFRAEIRSLRGRSRWSSSEVPNFCRRSLVEPSFIEAEPSEHSVILNPHQHTSSWIPAFAAEHSRNSMELHGILCWAKSISACSTAISASDTFFYCWITIEAQPTLGRQVRCFLNMLNIQG